SRKQNASVIMTINHRKLLMYACNTDEKIGQDQIAAFQWNEIVNYYIVDRKQKNSDNKENLFIFEYKRSSMKINKTVQCSTFYSLYLYDCFERVFHELNLVKPNNKTTANELQHIRENEPV
ncbi:unnamed protein product, partial [Didymodactylos carnosus]